MKLHLPLFLRKALLAACCVASCAFLPSSLADDQFTITCTFSLGGARDFTKNVALSDESLNSYIEEIKKSGHEIDYIKSIVSKSKTLSNFSLHGSENNSNALIRRTTDFTHDGNADTLTLDNLNIIYITGSLSKSTLKSSNVIIGTIELLKDVTDSTITSPSIKVTSNNIKNLTITDAESSTIIAKDSKQLSITGKLKDNKDKIANLYLGDSEGKTIGLYEDITLEDLKDAKIYNASINELTASNISSLSSNSSCFSGSLDIQNVDSIYFSSTYNKDKYPYGYIFNNVSGGISGYSTLNINNSVGSGKEAEALLSFDGNFSFISSNTEGSSLSVLSNSGCDYFANIQKGQLVLEKHNKIEIKDNTINDSVFNLSSSESSESRLVFSNNNRIEFKDNTINDSVFYLSSSKSRLVFSNNKTTTINNNKAPSGTKIPYSITSDGGDVWLNTQAESGDSSITIGQHMHIVGDVHLNKYEDKLGIGRIIFKAGDADSILSDQSNIDISSFLYKQNRLDARTNFILGNVTLYSGSLVLNESATLEIIKNKEKENENSGILSLSDNTKMHIEASSMTYQSKAMQEEAYSFTALNVVDFNLGSNIEIYIDFLDNFNRYASTEEPIIKIENRLTYAGAENEKLRLYIPDVEWEIANRAIPLLSANEIDIKNENKKFTFDKTNQTWLSEGNRCVEFSPEILSLQKNEVPYYDVTSWIGENDYNYTTQLHSAWIGNTLYLYKPDNEQWVKNLSIDILESKAKDQKIDNLNDFNAQKTTWRGDLFEILDIDKKNTTDKTKPDYDRMLCWLYTAANIIQYWQDKYAPLYQGDEPLVTNRKSSDSSEAIADRLKALCKVDGGTGYGTTQVLNFWFKGETQTKKNENGDNSILVFSAKEAQSWWKKIGISAKVTDLTKLDAKGFYETVAGLLIANESPVGMCYEWVDKRTDEKGEPGFHIMTCWGIDLIDEKKRLDCALLYRYR